MQAATRARVLRCPCGERVQASNDGALHRMLREHIEREHPYTDAPPDERLKEMVSSAVYGFEYVTIGSKDGLEEEEEFGPDPY
jgi:hypothetical protein